MRERTPLNRQLLSQLPNLKLIVSTGRRNASIDVQAAIDLGIAVENTGYLTMVLRNIRGHCCWPSPVISRPENTNFFSGKWQTTIGTDLKGKTIGIVGLGNIGLKIVEYAKAFDMKVIAWSQNLTREKAMAAGVDYVGQEVYSGIRIL